jgi:hypothetical protein
LYVSPIDSWQKFYEDISDVEKTLKIQTYDFTKKELKTKFKDLLEK